MGVPLSENTELGQKACKENRGAAEEILAGAVVDILEHYMPKP